MERSAGRRSAVVSAFHAVRVPSAVNREGAIDKNTVHEFVRGCGRVCMYVCGSDIRGGYLKVNKRASRNTPKVGTIVKYTPAKASFPPLTLKSS